MSEPASTQAAATEEDPLGLHIGEKAVYPPEGVVEVVRIETRDVGGTPTTFYVFHGLSSGREYLVPRKNATAPTTNVRRLIDAATAERIMATLHEPTPVMSPDAWNDQHQRYRRGVMDGSPIIVAQCFRDLARRRAADGGSLSFFDQHLFDGTRLRLVKELSIVQQKPEDAVAAELFRAVGAAPP